MEIEKQVAELVNEKVTTAKKETESKIDSVKSELASAIELKHNEISHSLVEAKSELMEVKNALSEMTKTSHKEEDKSIYAQVDKYIDDNIEAMKAQFKSVSTWKGIIALVAAVVMYFTPADLDNVIIMILTTLVITAIFMLEKNM